MVKIIENKIKVDSNDLWLTCSNDCGLEFENGLDHFVLKLIAMEEGLEFILSNEELSLLAENLISR